MTSILFLALILVLVMVLTVRTRRAEAMADELTIARASDEEPALEG